MSRDRFKKIVTALGMGVALCLGHSAHAQGTDAILDLLLRKGVITDQEAAELKKQVDADLARMIDRSEKTRLAKWIQEMKWSSDLRLRAEYFDFEDKLPSGETPSADRLRYRIRLRLGFESKLQDWATIGVRLATGGDDPVSSNQSFTDTFKRKPFNLDLAYVTIHPPGWDWVSVTGGKMKNPIWQTGISSPLHYDHDVTPEGIAEQFSWQLGENKQHKLFANLGQFVLKEVSGDVNDQYLFEFQGGWQSKLDPVSITVAGGYSITSNLDRLGPGDSPNRGNATVGGMYLDDFRVANARGELSWTLRKEPWLGTPCVLTFSGEYMKNLNDRFKSSSLIPVDPDQTEAYSGQVAFGGSRRKGEWQLAYQYKHLEADATWDAITDSDWGSGGTDRKGHVIKAAYNLQEWWQLGFTAFITEKISDRPNSGNNQRGLRGEDLLRVQMDTVFKF
jgi:hypothetical protein